jgi:hypothetical protein
VTIRSGLSCLVWPGEGLFTFQLVVTDVATGAQEQSGSDFTVYPVGTQP